MINPVRGDPSIGRHLRICGRPTCGTLALSALLVLSAVNAPAMANGADDGPHGHGGGGGHGGGARGGGAGNRGGNRGGDGGGNHGGGDHGGGRGYGGWGGGYYPGPAVIFGSPYYCTPPLVYVPDNRYDYCE